MGGSKANTADSSNNALDQLREYNQTQQRNPAVSNLLSSYGQGGTSLQDALSRISQMPQDQQRAATDALMTSAGTGSKVASDQIQQDGLTKGIFGQGGVQDQAQANYGNVNNNLTQDRQAMMGNDPSYGLNEQDLAAYGQASGNIARQFGGAENNLTQNLASRGLASAASGAAGAQFSGLEGSKNEQLAASQQAIAQNRIQTAQQLANQRTQQDLANQGQTGNMIQGLGNLGQAAQGQRYAQNAEGANNNYNQMNNLASQNMNNQSLQQNVNNAQFNQEQSTNFGAKFGQTAGAIGSLAGAAKGAFGG